MSKIVEHLVAQSVPLKDLHDLEYKLKLLQTDYYKRYKYILTYLFEKFDKRSSTDNKYENKEYFLNSKDTEEITNHVMSKYTVPCLNKGALHGVVKKRLECIHKGNTISEYKMTTETLIKLAELLTSCTRLDDDFFEKRKLLNKE